MTLTTFGHLADGRAIREVTLRNAAGASAVIMEWGATLRDMAVPHQGKTQRVVVNLTTLDDFLKHTRHFGATAGRYANRIAGGRFVLDGKAHQLPLNQAGRHSLHGGGEGFGKRPWTILHHDAASATLGLISPDGDHGYPGAVAVTCRYTLADTATLRVELTATTDAATIINLCHHSYFNLDGSPDILEHELEVRANLYTPCDADLIPDGTVASVAGTGFDFRKPRPIRLINPDGTRFWYDQNYILRRDRREPSVMPGLEVAHAATLRSPKNGLGMQVWTTEPACQVYDGANCAVPASGLDGTPIGPSAGICLEPQHVPDSPNLPHFPGTVLRPGEVYRQVTEYRFG